MPTTLTHSNPPQNVPNFFWPEILLVFSHEYTTLKVIFQSSVSHSVDPLHESDVKFTDVLTMMITSSVIFGTTHHENLFRFWLVASRRVSHYLTVLGRSAFQLVSAQRRISEETIRRRRSGRSAPRLKGPTAGFFLELSADEEKPASDDDGRRVE